MKRLKGKLRFNKVTIAVLSSHELHAINGKTGIPCDISLTCGNCSVTLECIYGCTIPVRVCEK